jgi:hypothetical protein
MSKQFKPGQEVIGQQFKSAPEWNGLEGVVLEYLGFRHCGHLGRSLGHHHAYSVRWSDGSVASVVERNLRPKRPPRRDIDEKVSWESVGWMPMDVKLDKAIKQALRDQVKERA